MHESAASIDYEILEPLGEGGMGIVYRARDRRTGELVAIKTVSKAHEELLASIRREVYALARIRHPGVVRILSDGLTDRLPWYAMELVEGETLRDYLVRTRTKHGRRAGPGDGSATDGTRALSEGPEMPATTIPKVLADTWPSDSDEVRQAASVSPPSSLPECLAVAANICDPLAYVHGEGIVHRDLKPDNIIVRPDGSTVLVDFALNTRFGGDASREVLDLDEHIVGTPGYMSPEQIQGELVDARSDLYSFGCLLFELLTGTVPFFGTREEMLRKHLYSEPEPISKRVPGVPAELEDLISRLLEKSPERRLGHAAEVASVLRRLGGAALEPRSGPRPRAYLYRPAFVGRREAIEKLDDRIATFCEGRGGTLFIGGESGVGKTRLAMELARHARRRGMKVVTGECVPIAVDRPATAQGGVLHPFRGFLGVVADRCRARGADETRTLLGEQGRVLGEIEPQLIQLEGFSDLPEPERLPPEASRQRLLRVVHDCLNRFAGSRPLLLLFDDIQWADELTLLFLRELQRARFGDTSVAVAATYRTEESNPALRKLVADEAAHEIVLQRLTPADVGSMVEAMLAVEHCPPELANLLARHSEGNPFFVAEYLRTALAVGLLSRQELQGWNLAHLSEAAAAEGSELPLPNVLRELILRRLAQLSTAARDLSEVAAVIGREGAEAILATVADEDDETLLDVLRELVDRQVLEQSAAGRFRFLHDKLREILYESLPDGRRRELHRRTAQSLEAGGEAVVQRFGLLAHHWAVAGVHVKAVAYLERRADSSLTHGAYQEVASSLIEANRLCAAGAIDVPKQRRATWERMLTRAYLNLGLLGDCDDHARATLSLIGRRVPKSKAGWVTLLCGELARQIGHLLLPGRLYERPGRALELTNGAQAAGDLGRVGFYASDPLRMVASSLLSVNLAERAGSLAEAARNYSGLGFNSGLLGMHRLAARYFERGRAAGWQAEDWPGLVFAITAETVYLLGQGRWGAARKLLEHGEVLSEKTGDPQDWEIIQALFGHLENFVGNYDASLQRNGKLLASARSRSNVQTEAWGLYFQGRSLVGLGLFDRAIQLLGEASVLLESQTDAMSDITCLGLLARALAERGDLEEAVEVAARVQEVVSQAQPTIFLYAHGHEGIAEVALRRWESAMLEGDADLARAAREEARRAVRRLWILSFTFPVVTPIAWRARAHYQRLLGRLRRARFSMRRSLTAAERLALPLEQALAHQGLAHLAENDSDRSAHTKAASTLYDWMGCARTVG